MSESNDTVGIDRLHRQALEATRSVVSAIAADQWADPTPCADWDVRDVVNHIVAGNWWAAELAIGATIADVGNRLDGDVLGESPVQAFDDSADAAARAFETEGALDAPCAVSYGPVPGSVYAGHRFVDVLIHGWDVAHATNQDTTLDAGLVDACWRIVEPQLDLLRASGMFGATEGTLGSTDAQARLLFVLGRADGR